MVIYNIGDIIGMVLHHNHIYGVIYMVPYTYIQNLILGKPGFISYSTFILNNICSGVYYYKRIFVNNPHAPIPMGII